MEKIIKKSQFTSPIIVLPHDEDPKGQKYKALQALRDAGMTVEQVSKICGVSRGTVCNHTEATVQLRGRHVGKYSHERAEVRKEYYIPLMLELRKLGYSNTDIAQKTGFHFTTVYKYIGTQPDEVSLASHRTAGAKIRFRNIAKKNQPERDAGKPIPTVAKVLESA